MPLVYYLSISKNTRIFNKHLSCFKNNLFISTGFQQLFYKCYKFLNLIPFKLNAIFYEKKIILDFLSSDIRILIKFFI